MPLQDITALPTAPARSDAPEIFIERADAFVAALPGLVTEINTLGDQLELTAALIDAAPAYADPFLVASVGNTPATDKVIYLTSSSASSTMTVTSAARSLLDDTTTGAMLTTLGLSANGKSLVTAADYAAMKALLDLEIGTDVQAYDADLTAFAGKTAPSGVVVGTTDSQTLTNKTLTSPALTSPTVDGATVATVSGTAPLYFARAWVNFNGTGTIAIRASGNVSSLTDDGVGKWTVNLTTALPSADVSANVSCGTSQSSFLVGFAYATSTTAIAVGSFDTGDTPSFVDVPYVQVTVTG